MDFKSGYDPTLPIDLDGSTNPDLLPEVTFGSHLEYPDGSIPMVAKTNNGRMSPVRARTMKEYDQQIAELKKENFSLKLRIYFLEERMQQKFGDGEDVFKTNIELKVEVESLKKELADKQELLKKASTAMESLTNNHQIEMLQVRDHIEHEKKRVREEIDQQKQKDSENAVHRLSEARQRIEELEGELDRLVGEIQLGKDTNKENMAQIEELKDTLNTRNREVSEVTSKLQSQAKQLKAVEEAFQQSRIQRQEMADAVNKIQKDLGRKERDMHGFSHEEGRGYQDVIDDQKEQLNKLQDDISDLQNKIAGKDDTIGKLEDSLKDKEKAIKDLDNEMRELDKDFKKEKENSLKRDKTIQGLMMALHEKSKEANGLGALHEKAEEELIQVKDELHKTKLARHQGEEKRLEELSEKDDKIARLEQHERENELKMENMMRTLGRKDGELVHFKELLEKAEQAMKQSEEAVEVLQEQLQKERDQAQDRMDAQTQHYKNLLDDSKLQSDNKDKIVQQMAERLKDKDRELQACMDMLNAEGQDLGGKVSLLKKLEERLQQKDKVIENVFEEKQQALQDKEGEIRELKQKLDERNQDLTRVSQLMQSAEEANDGLENEVREKDLKIKQLANSLRTAQNSLEEALDNHSRAAEEKEGNIHRLQASLAAKDKILEEAMKQGPTNDDLLKTLRKQLKEKDGMLEDLFIERNKAMLDNDRANRELLNTLWEKDGDIKALTVDKQDIQKKLRDIQQYVTTLDDKTEECNRLQREVLNLKEQLNERGTPAGDNKKHDTESELIHLINEQLKEIRLLSESLRKEHQIFITLNQQDGAQRGDSSCRSAAFETELGAVQALRKQLEEGVDRNNKLRIILEHQVTGSAPSSSGTETDKIILEHLGPDRFVDIPDGIHAVRSSTSPQRRSSGSGYSKNYTNAQTSPKPLTNPSDHFGRLSPQTSYHSTQTSPFNPPRDIRSPELSPSSDGSPFLGRSAPYDKETLSRMSSSMLRKLVQQLQEDLVAALRQNSDLQQYAFGGLGSREVPGRNDTDPTAADFQHMQEQVDELRDTLQRKQHENEILRTHLGLEKEAEFDAKNLPNVRDLQNEVLKLRSQFKEVCHLNDLLKKQINMNSQSLDSPDGFNPDLILEMASEIEKLKSEIQTSYSLLAEYQRHSGNFRHIKSVAEAAVQTSQPDVSQSICQVSTLDLENYEQSDINGDNGLDAGGNKFQGNNSDRMSGSRSEKKSQIPRLQKLQPVTSNVSHENHPLILQSRLQGSQEQIKQLLAKLAATEGTVRYQTQKMKYYKSLLQDAGIVPLQESRSQSDISLAVSGSRSWQGSWSNLSSPQKNGFQDTKSLVLDELKDYGKTDSVSVLKKQVGELKGHLERYVQKLESSTVGGSCDRGISPHRKSVSPVNSLATKRAISHDNIAQACNMEGSVERLQIRIRSLENQLHESQTENLSLQQKLGEFQRSAHPEVKSHLIEMQKLEITSLQKQVVESQNVNTQLRSELEKLNNFLSELIHHDQNGHSDPDLTSASIGSLRHHLNQSLSVLRNTSSDFSQSDASRTGSSEKESIEEKYRRALKQIDQLQLQQRYDQERYNNNIEAKNAEINHLSDQAERFQKEFESVRQPKRNVEADGSPLALDRQTGRHNKYETDTDSLRSTSPSDGVPKTCGGRLIANVQKTVPGKYESESLESEDIQIHKLTDTNYGQPLEPVHDNSVERLRHRTASGHIEGRLYRSSEEVDIPEKLRHRNASGFSEKNLSRSEKMDIVEKLRHRMVSGVTDDGHSAQSVEGFSMHKDSSLWNSHGKMCETNIQEEMSDFSKHKSFHGAGTESSNRHSVGNGSHYYSGHSSEKYEIPHLYDSTLNPLWEDRNGEARDFVDSAETSSKKSTIKIFDYDTQSEISSSHGRSQSPETEFDRLKARLNAVEDLNTTLKNELSIYETLCTSVSIQATPKLSSTDPRPNKGVDNSDSNLLLQEHLAEIRALRLRLEENLEDSDRLRGQLEQKLREPTRTTTINMHHDECDRKIQELQDHIRQLKEELGHRDANLRERIIIIEEKERIVNETNIFVEKQKRELSEKQKKIADREQLCLKLNQKKEKMEQQLKKAAREIKRLQQETTALTEKCQEKTDLNTTLKLELSVHEKLQARMEGNGDKKAEFDIREFLMELRHLRVQLERCIDTNNALRQKLEDLLKKQLDQATTTNVYHIRNRSPTCSLTTDATDGRPSPEPASRQSKRDVAEKETYIKKFTSETEYRYNIYGSKDFDLIENGSEHFPSDSTSKSSPDIVTVTSDHNGCSTNNAADRLHLSSSVPGPKLHPDASLRSLPGDLGQIRERRHLASVENIKYWVDARPGESEAPRVTVDSDIRHLFAIGKLDDFEKLKRENSEGRSALSGIDARLQERLKVLKTMSTSQLIKSVEYSTLRELSLSVENLRICLNEEDQGLKNFWISQLPPVNELGEFYDPKLSFENDSLKRELVQLRSKYDMQNHYMKTSEERLQATNKQRENMEEAIFKQLSITAKVLKRTKDNLEVRAKEAGYRIPSSKLRSYKKDS